MVHDELHALKVEGPDAEPDAGTGACEGTPPRPSRCRSRLDSQGLVSPLFIQTSTRWWLLGEEDDRGRRRTGMAAGFVHASRSGQVTTSVEKIALSIASRLDVLCFDEVAITTIQDCVVLGPLLRVMCDHSVVVVATSNRTPASLYAGGLNRHVHLPTVVEAIHNACDVHHLDSGTDHRVRMHRSDTASDFFWGCSPSSRHGTRLLDDWWARETGT